MHRICEVLCNDLKGLEQNGLEHQRPEGIFHFSCQLFLVLGDNLAQHQVGFFYESFVAWMLSCRFCIVNINELRAGMMGNDRTVDAHNQQVALVQNTPDLAPAYGVKGSSALSCLAVWHCATSLLSDLAHDMFEGVAKNTLKQVLQHYTYTSSTI